LRYKTLCSHLKYVSQDFGQYSGEGNIGLQTGHWDQSKLDIVSDIINLPISADSFDAVMCIEVLEHLPDPIRALHELTRLLKPNGVLIVTAPFCSLTHFAPYFFHTGFSRYFYEYWLEKLGYTIEEMQWNGNYFEYLAQELRRLPWSSKTYIGKPFSYFNYGVIYLLLALLNTLSNNAKGSEQLLAFGLHVKARKKN